VVAGLALLTSLSVTSELVAAEEPSVEDVKAAGEQFNFGRTAFKEQDYAVAAEHFERADGLAPNAKVLQLAIQAREQAGQVGRAAMLGEVAKRRYPGDERFAETDAIVARAERNHARVDVSCDQPCNLVVGMRLIHGEAASEWVLFLEPGEHEVRAGWGDQDVSKQYSAVSGERGTLTFEAPEEEAPAVVPVQSEPESEEYSPLESPFSGGLDSEAPRSDDDEAQGPDGPVAIVFGREDRGLPNEVLDRANVHVTIPTTSYASLNLAQAVMVGLYELHLEAGEATRPRKPPRKDAPPPEAAELERFHADVDAALRAIDFFKTRYPEHVLRAVRSMVSRAAPDARELSLLRAMAIEVVKKLERVRRLLAPHSAASMDGGGTGEAEAGERTRDDEVQPPE
jgi:hypothetical protein